MTPWRKGNKIGSGEVYLPDDDARAAYGSACLDAILYATAKQVLRMKELAERRQFIANYPQALQPELKEKIKALWAEKQKELI
jgi:hypothetical protein